MVRTFSMIKVFVRERASYVDKTFSFEFFRIHYPVPFWGVLFGALSELPELNLRDH